MPVVVAVTYNEDVGGVSVMSLIKAFEDLGCEVVQADYRLLTTRIAERRFADVQSQSGVWGRVKARAWRMLAQIDVLVLSGSNAMVNPEFFGEARDARFRYDTRRVVAELALVHAAVTRGMPIFGVCAGHQLISVYFGGTLRSLTRREIATHHRMHTKTTIEFDERCVLAQLVGEAAQEFFGSHRQVVEKLGFGLQHCAVSAGSPCNEAFESQSGAPVIGTQFHPEVALFGLMSLSQAIGDESAQRSALNIFVFMRDCGRTFRRRVALARAFARPRPAPGCGRAAMIAASPAPRGAVAQFLLLAMVPFLCWIGYAMRALGHKYSSKRVLRGRLKYSPSHILTNVPAL